MTKPATIAEQLKTMAEHLIKRVLEPGDIPPTLAEETAAFKAVTAYHAMNEKGEPPDPDDEALFKRWQQKTQEGESDEVAVPSARGRGNGSGAGTGTSRAAKANGGRA